MIYEPGSARSIRKRGTWLRDEAGRYVLLRGVNLGSRAKLAPYLSIYPLERRDGAVDVEVFRQELGRVRGALDTLERLGFNVVRLLVMWKALEPKPLAPGAPLSDDARTYLTCLREILDALYERRIYAFIDFHQDLAHEAFHGDGFPDWAIPDGAHPGLQVPGLWQSGYVLDEGVKRTLAAFWSNDVESAAAGSDGRHAQECFALTVQRVAESLRDHDAVLGYEPFNEPNGAGRSADQFEGERSWLARRSMSSNAVLPVFYRNVIGKIRAVDQRALIFVEPRVDWNVIRFDPFPIIGDVRDSSTQLAIDDTTDPSLVFSFHHYDTWTMVWGRAGHGDSMAAKEREWPAAYSAMVNAASERGLVPFLTEHGGDNSWSQHGSDLRRPSYGNELRAYVDLQFRQIEGHLLSSTYWNFDLYGDGWNGEDFSMLDIDGRVRNEDIQRRPFPHRSAARPVFLWFDVDAKLFILALEDAPEPAPTVVYVPQALHYPGGFDAHATGVDLSWDPAHQMLLWQHAPGETRHLLVIVPRGAAFPPVWPGVYAYLPNRPTIPTLVRSFP